MVNQQDILDFFETKDISKDGKNYVNFHSIRYAFVINLLRELIGDRDQAKIKLLDIGPAYQTVMIRHYFPDLIINTLGYKHYSVQLRDNEKHLELDINTAQYPKKVPDFDEHNIILFAEVIEHLYTSPKFVLAMLYKYMRKDGQLIIQTPNAVAIHKRFYMLMGKNPYMHIAENPKNPAHFREYTANELRDYCQKAQLDVEKIYYQNYFIRRASTSHAIFTKSEPFLPKNWRDGLTVVARK